jgi:hypothetical protein
VVSAQHPFIVGQDLLVQRDGLPQPSRRLIGVGQVEPRGQGAGVVGAQYPFTIGGQWDAKPDHLTRTVIQLVHQPHPPHAQPEQGLGTVHAETSQMTGDMLI